METRVDLVDMASFYLADEIPLEEFCTACERWWEANRTDMPENEVAASKALIDAIAWYSEDDTACIPAGKKRDEQSVRLAVMDYLEFMLRSRNAKE
ncbi:MAG: hypothetical protein R3F24_14665 [Gammaproteobacteria bacterium]